MELFDEIDDFLKAQANNESESMLEDVEVQSLIMSLALSRGAEGFDEDEAVAVVEWATKVRIESAMLELALKGLCSINWIDNEITFKANEATIEYFK